jgi:hypothetical protein
MLGMRRSVGVSADQVIGACIDLPDAWETFESLEHDGYVTYEDGRFVPTRQGWLLGNHLYGRILDLAP